MFCSENCQQKAMAGLHQFRCKMTNSDFAEQFEIVFHKLIKCLAVFDYNVEELKTFLKINKGKTLFDYDLSDTNDPMHDKYIISLWTSLTNSQNKCDRALSSFRIRFADIVKRIPKLNQLWNTDEHFLANLLFEIIFNRSGLAVQESMNKFQDENSAGEKTIVVENTGSASYLLPGMLNHNCDPNVKIVIISNKTVTYACKPIKKGSEILSAIYSFSHTGPKAERQRFLTMRFGSACKCTACQKDWPTFQELRSIDPLFQYKAFKSFSSKDIAKKTIARNNAYVDKNYKENDPSQEVYITIDNNFFELIGLARPSFYT